LNFFIEVLGEIALRIQAYFQSLWKISVLALDNNVEALMLR
jgi:hypothetical protein